MCTGKHRAQCVDFSLAEIDHERLGHPLRIPRADHLYRLSNAAAVLTLSHKCCNHCIVDINLDTERTVAERIGLSDRLCLS